jgi:hypothetical protein
MIPRTEQSELIRCYIEGSVTAQQIDALQQHLRADPAFRRLFARYANLDAALGDGRLAAPSLARPASPSRQQSTFKWLSWRPLAAAAAGLVFGMFCTSVVFAYAKPKPPSAATKPLPLADADFESNSPIPALGIPAVAGVWSGDFSRIVGAEKGITPRHGLRMLQILRSDNESSPKHEYSYVGEVAQVIDLRPLRATLSGAEHWVDVSAYFNSIGMGRDGKCEFAVKAAAFQGDTADAPRLWDDHEASGSRSNRSVEADFDPRTWQRVATPLVLPANADFLVVECAVVFKGTQKEQRATEFPGHYIDQVEVRLNDPSRVWTETQTGD